jgi:superfamily II DNA/RNA helicase
MTDRWPQLSELKPFLQETWDKMGFVEPTSVQIKTIPMALEEKDLIVQSPTGTGKTFCYALPILHKINVTGKTVQAVVLAPTRELVIQIHDVFKKWGEAGGISIASFIGGADIKRQIEKLKNHPQVVIGTPGRILELIRMKKLKMHEVKTIVLDEADQLLIPELLETIKGIIKSTMRDRQVLAFSATLPEKTVHVAKELMQNPEIIRIKDVNSSANTEHIYFLSPPREKFDLLRRIVRGESLKGLVFVNDSKHASLLADKFHHKRIPAQVLLGEMGKMERENALKQFRQGSVHLLVATDIAARGLDIEGISHVIHFDVPEDLNQYIHRSGRTGRMGAPGKVISIATFREEQFLMKFSRQLGIPIQKKILNMGKIMDAE